MTAISSGTRCYYGTGTNMAGRMYQNDRQVWPFQPFTPLSLPGLRLWLDASTIAGTGQVTNWPDASGNGHNASPFASEAGPAVASVSGKKVLDFTSVRMNVAGLGAEMQGRSAYSVAWVCFPSSFGTYPIVLSAPTNTTWQWILEYHVDGGVYLGQGNGRYAEFAPITLNAVNQWSQVTATVSGASRRLWMNGTECVVSFLGPNGDIVTPMPPLGTLDAVLCGYYTGNPIAWSGYFAELAIYDHALTDADRQKIEGYLHTKWIG